MAENCADTNTKTTGKIDEYKRNLSSSIKNAESEALISISAYKNAALNKVDKENCYTKLNDGFGKYKNLSIAAGSELAKDTEELFLTISKCKSDVKKAVDTKLGNTIKALKKLKEEVKGVNEAACKLKSEISDNCNAQQLTIMRNKVEGSCDFSILPTGDNNFDTWIKGICQDVDKATEDISELQNIAVSAAGVNALVNYTNLEIVSKTLKEKAEELNTNINDNIDAAKKESNTACEDLATAIEELSTKTFEERKANLKKKSLYKICDFINNKDCKPAAGEPANWDEIKDKINNLLCNKAPVENPGSQSKLEDKAPSTSSKKSKKDMS